MSTGTDIANDLVGLLAETVERGASLLAGGTRLAGPAAVQEMPSELVPDETTTCVGLGLTFADGTAVTLALTLPLAEELCGGTTADHLRSGLQVVVDEVGVATAGLAEVIAFDGNAELEHFLTGRSVILGAGVFDGDAVVATIGGAGPSLDAPAPAAAPTPAAEAPAPAAPTAETAPAPAPATTADRAVAPHQPTSGAPAGLAVPDEVLARGLALLADVNLEVTAELGRSHLRVSELLSLEPGSVIGLERAAGSPVDLLVNGSLFARAEVIVEDGKYAVRITELLGNGIGT